MSDSARAWRRLVRRGDVALAASCAHPKDRVRVVGGVVRDAFLDRVGGDLDLIVARGHGATFAERLAARAGSRVVAVGTAPRRILKVAYGGRAIDVWEEEGDTAADLLRRDFTVNAVSFTLPDGRCEAAPGALEDLAKRRLAPPRPGVFLEDPLRVLRAARFLAELPGFRVARSAEREIGEAGRLLGRVAEERRLVELDRILGAPPAGRTRALRFLARVGALDALLLGPAPHKRRGGPSSSTRSTQRERRTGISRGISLVSRLKESDPHVARALLLLPQGPKRAEDLLGRWKTSREEQRLASRLFSLPLRARGTGGRPTRRDVAEFLRRASPFEEQSVAFLEAAGGPRARALTRGARRVLRRPSALRRILKPARPLPLEEIQRILGLREGPELGRTLADLDLALAAGEIRGTRAARAWTVARARSWRRRASLAKLKGPR